MQIKHIENIPISSILKNNLYLNGIIVSDKVFELLSNSQYSGYRTTTGIFMKLGGTLSEKDFRSFNPKNKDTLLSEFPKDLSYEDYLAVREYTTAPLKLASSIDSKDLKDKTYFILDVDSKGRLYIIGQYVNGSSKYPIKLDDCGVFMQDSYEDEAVAIQAGGIRLRDSICGENCISGCSFCDFGKNSDSYVENTLNSEKIKYLTDLIKKLTLNSKVQTLFITGGNPSLADMTIWTDFVEESIKTFKAAVPDGLIDVMLTPRGFDRYVYDDENRYKEYKKYLEYLRSIGVDTISPNMELWDQKDLDKFCSICSSGANKGTTKSEIGHNGYIDFIKAGIEVFGKYNVRTSLIIGLNSNENIKQAIKDLISTGCYVVLLPFKSPNEHFNALEPTVSDLIELSNYLKLEMDKTLKSTSANLAQTYSKRISDSLNAHNSHNTANLCCMQDLDIIEKQALHLGKDYHIVSDIRSDDKVI